MTVFKGYMLMFKRNVGTALMYFAIFLAIAILITASTEKENAKSFVEAKVAVSMVNLDNGELSKNLVNYLQKKHDVDIKEDNKSVLYEELYYGKKSVVLRIQENFEEKVFKGESGVYLTNAPGSYKGIYLEQQINLYVSNVVSYCESGYSMEEACRKVEAQKESKITIDDVNGNGGQIQAYATFFQYIPYMLISVFGSVLGKILYEFRRKNVKKRATASSYSLVRQNVETILAFVVIGTGTYLFTVLTAVILYGRDFLASQNAGWYLLNAFASTLVSLAIAFIIGIFVKTALQVTIIATPLGLGLSFLCGVFVPLEVLSVQIKNIAKFLPVYWYEVVNGLLSDYADIDGDIFRQVISGIGVQLLFVVLLLGFAMAVLKYQRQE